MSCGKVKWIVLFFQFVSFNRISLKDRCLPVDMVEVKMFPKRRKRWELRKFFTLILFINFFLFSHIYVQNLKKNLCQPDVYPWPPPFRLHKLIIKIKILIVSSAVVKLLRQLFMSTDTILLKVFFLFREACLIKVDLH